MWISDALDELTYDREDDGVLVRKQLERVVLARGSWATVLLLFQELDRATGAYGGAKVAVLRFQKWRGGWRKHAAFTLAGEAQARELAAALDRWAPLMRADQAELDDEPAGEPDEATHRAGSAEV
jgi:hypothetical protein